ncbi:MAG: PLP-dependent aminotransferase family protein, partial [Chloroflexales bacterium]|nr:PLP-dependent aminotransferase family protein [Chloroflexales bacterium]
GGWVEATVGRGTFVAEQEERTPTPTTSELGQEVTPRGVMNDLLRMAQMPGLLSLAMNDPDADAFPLRDWQRCTDEALEQGGARVMGYATPQGDQSLRNALATLVHERGLTVGPDEIMVTGGATQALALTCDALARPGDTVLVEQPTYLGSLNIMAARGLQPIGIATDDEGLQIEPLERALQQQRPALIYTIPTFQNPSGVCLSNERRAALLELAARHNVPIIEDDVYGRLCYEGVPPPALKAADARGLVVHIGSLSKILMPGLRMGYIVATPALLQQLSAARQASDLCSPLLTQRALALFIGRGLLTSHIRRSLPRYRERRDALLLAMEQHFPAGVFWTRPRGGFACWVALPVGSSVTELYMAAIARGVAFAPGDVFCAAPLARPHMRLSFGAQTPHAIAEAVSVLGELLRERAGHRALPVSVKVDCVPLV